MSSGRSAWTGSSCWSGIGAESWAILASLVATCKMSAVNPVDYLTDTLRAILDGHPKSRLENIEPWRYTLPSSLAA